MVLVPHWLAHTLEQLEKLGYPVFGGKTCTVCNTASIISYKRIFLPFCRLQLIRSNFVLLSAFGIPSSYTGFSWDQSDNYVSKFLTRENERAR